MSAPADPVESPSDAPRTGPGRASPEDPELVPLVGDLMRRAVKRLWRRSRAEVSRAAAVSKDALALRQKEADLDAFWRRLGRTAYHLVEAEEIDHPALRKAMERIDQLQTEIDEARRGGGSGLPEE